MTGAPASNGLPVATRAWVVFLLADFLLSWATSTGNSYLVVLIDTLGGADLADVSASATRAVGAATLTAIVFAVLGGMVSRNGRASVRVFAAGTLAVGIGLLITVLSPTAPGLLVAAIVFGAGFGAANGAELALAVQLRGSADVIGGDLGLLNAVTSIPYVLAPAAAALILAGDLASGLRVLYGLAVLMAVIGAVLALRIRPSTATSMAAAAG